MLGGSYLGIAQWRAALSQQPAPHLDLPRCRRIGRVSRPLLLPRRRSQTRSPISTGPRTISVCPAIGPLDFASIVRQLPIRTADRVATGRDGGLLAAVAVTSDLRQLLARSRSTYERLATPHACLHRRRMVRQLCRRRPGSLRALTAELDAHRLVIGPWRHNMSLPFPSGIYVWQANRAPRSAGISSTGSSTGCAVHILSRSASRSTSAPLRHGGEPMAR